MAKDPGRSPGAFIVPNCVEVRINWTLPNGKIVHNVLHGRVAGGFLPTAAMAETIRAAIVASASWTAYKVYVNGASAFASLDLRDMSQLNQPIVPSNTTPAAGTGVA